MFQMCSVFWTALIPLPPQAVHQLVVDVSPSTDASWGGLAAVPTDGVHSVDAVGPNRPTPESRSEGIKRLKFHYLVKLIDELKMVWREEGGWADDRRSSVLFFAGRMLTAII